MHEKDSKKDSSYGKNLIKKLAHEMSEQRIAEARRLATVYTTEDQDPRDRQAPDRHWQADQSEAPGVSGRDQGRGTTADVTEPFVANDWTAKQLREAKKVDKQTKPATPPRSQNPQSHGLQDLEDVRRSAQQGHREPEQQRRRASERLARRSRGTGRSGRHDGQARSFQKLHKALLGATRKFWR